MMKNKNLIIILSLTLSSCAAPTSSLETSQTSREGYIFYIDQDTYLHFSELDNKIILPTDEYGVPEYTNLLPNALREYRNGIHEGIDFSSPLNYPIKAVYDGIVIRSNNQHEDVDINTYNELLLTTEKLKKTPEDIYNFILLGKSIVIDHGYSITKKFRTVTVYAHLSSIPNEIKPGTRVAQGDIIGFSGNTGTSSGALRNEKGAHLHWEIHFDDSKGRYFLGQNIPEELLHSNIVQLFENQVK